MTRSRQPTASALALALGLLALASVACGDGGSSDAEYEEYFNVVGAELLALEQDLTALAASAQDLTGEPLAANLDVYADTLDASRLVLVEVTPPGEAGEPHARLIEATQALAVLTDQQASSARGAPGVPSADDLAAQGLSRASEWYAACHDLQDMALVRDIDADLRCVTALGG